jgi:glycosyltransferase involved in cell wall biosynthesis
MNILFFTYDFPYPLNTGGKIRAYHLLKQLAKKHRVTLVSFYRNEEQKEYKNKLDFIQSIFFIKRRNLYSLGTLPYIFQYPFPIALYKDSSVNKLHTFLKDKKFDSIHYESLYTTVFFDMYSEIPHIFGTENIEWKIYSDYLAQQSFFIKPLLNVEILRIKKYEESMWRKSISCIAVSEENASEIEQVGSKTCEVIPNGVDIDTFNFEERRFDQKEIRFLFVGSMYYIQNKDATEFLIKDIWPELMKIANKYDKRICLTLVGPGTESLYVKDTTIVTKGEVDDINEIYRNHDILLAPLRAGSGTKFKVLEAASVGMPVIATEIGAQGIPEFHDKEDVLIADSPSSFGRSFEFILLNQSSVKQMTKKARSVIEKHYSWNSIGIRLLHFYEKIVNNHR